MKGESYVLTRISPLREAFDYKDWSAIGGLDLYGQHQLLWKFFDLPRNKTPARAEFLFRAEMRDGLPLFYVLSRMAPRDTTGKWCIEPREYRPDLRPGDRLAFKLRANPTVARAGEGGGRGERHDVVMDAKQRMNWKELPVDERPTLAHVAYEAGSCWLRGREERLGCRFEANRLRADGHRVHRMPARRGIVLSTLDFEGELQVMDPDRFLKDGLLAGIGSAKAFGCGLMLVRRA